MTALLFFEAFAPAAINRGLPGWHCLRKGTELAARESMFHTALCGHRNLESPPVSRNADSLYT